MLTDFDRTTILYFLIALFGTGVIIAQLYRYRLYKIIVAKQLSDSLSVEEELIEYDPVINDLMADLFIGHLTGYVIGLIDGNEQELRFYRQLVDIIYSSFILGKSDEVVPVSVDTFVKQITCEINNIPSDNLQRYLNERLFKLVKGIETTSYYTQDSQMAVGDVYDALTQCFNLIKHYDVINMRRQ